MFMDYFKVFKEKEVLESWTLLIVRENWLITETNLCLSLSQEAKHFLFSWLFCNTFSFCPCKTEMLLVSATGESTVCLLISPDGLCPAALRIHLLAFGLPVGSG